MSQKTELSLIAVNLVNDVFPHCHQLSDNINNNGINGNTGRSLCVSHSSGDVLGFVALSSLSVKLSDFRLLMSQQIQSLPNRYIFLSKEGWPVSSIQEANLNLYYVVNTDNSMVLIRRQFDKQRFGIESMGGQSLGFIFADLENLGLEIRKSIAQELSLNDMNSYQLIDRNGWPVSKNQELVVKGWDLIVNGVFRVLGVTKEVDNEVHDINNTLDEIDSPIRKKKRPSETSTIEIIKPVMHSEDSSHNILSILPVTPLMAPLEPVTPATASSAATLYHPLSIEVKPILISYVRAEAEQHARQLKSELQDLGCNVFLDVDEIEGGHDWADALNNAVLNCELFVPLITPQYGYTQWTNREVKLADIKKKQIIPISFLDSWPPECLAIQFASTQYIPWKTPIDIEKSFAKGEGERARDIRFWDQPYVRTTATTISEHMKNANIEKEKSTTQIVQIPVPPTDADLQSNMHFTPPDVPTRPNLLNIGQHKKRPNIVISCHPSQKEFSSLIRQELSKYQFDVWCSTDMTFGAFSTAADIIPTPTNECSTPVVSHAVKQWVNSQRLDSDSDQMSDQTVYIGNSQYSEDSQESQNLSQNHEKHHFSSQKRAHNRHKLNFSLNIAESVNNFPQCSQDFFGSQTCILTPEDLDKAHSFRDRVDAASIVIIILSKAYCKSRTCKQQAFYCDIRKRVIPIKYDDFRTPHWLSKLFDDDEMLEHNANDIDSFLSQLNQKAAKLCASSKDTFKCAMSEARIHSLASYVSRQLPQIHEKKKVLVYVAGSSKFFSPLSEAICRAIGQSLASIPFLVLVTGGVYGVAETTGRTFCEERELLLKEKPANLYHILPRYVSQDQSMKARQNPDGTFQNLPFGHTLFIGDSFKERDSVVARLFNYCIIIEGGPRSARIAEEFMWNDNIVIPIICTGGAAAGQFDLPPKIHDVPLGVHQDDWSTLVRRDVTAENIAESVKNIICSLVKCRSRKKMKDKHVSGFRNPKNRTNKMRTKQM